MSSVSIIVETTDHQFYVLPHTLISDWKYFSSIMEATGCTGDDVIPVPFDSEQFDKWLQFAILRDSGYVELLDTSKTKEDIISAGVDEYEILIRTMDFQDDTWMLYCTKEEGSDEELLNWYYELGYRVTKDLYEYVNKEDTGSKFSIYCKNSSNIFDQLIMQIYNVSQDFSEYTRDCMIVLGIIHNGWVKASCPYNINWKSVDWRMMMRLGVSYVVEVAKFPDRQHTCCISHSVEMLCYDGNPVEYGHCCDHIPTESGSGFIDLPDTTGEYDEITGDYNEIDTLNTENYRELCCRIMRFCLDRLTRIRPTSNYIDELLGLSTYIGSASKTAHVDILHYFNERCLTKNSSHNGTVILHDNLFVCMGEEYYQLMVEAQLLKLKLQKNEWRKIGQMDTS